LFSTTQLTKARNGGCTQQCHLPSMVTFINIVVLISTAGPNEMFYYYLTILLNDCVTNRIKVKLGNITCMSKFYGKRTFSKYIFN